MAKLLATVLLLVLIASPVAFVSAANAEGQRRQLKQLGPAFGVACNTLLCGQDKAQGTYIPIVANNILLALTNLLKTIATASGTVAGSANGAGGAVPGARKLMTLPGNFTELLSEIEHDISYPASHGNRKLLQGCELGPLCETLFEFLDTLLGKNVEDAGDKVINALQSCANAITG